MKGIHRTMEGTHKEHAEPFPNTQLEPVLSHPHDVHSRVNMGLAMQVSAASTGPLGPSWLEPTVILLLPQE